MTSYKVDFDKKAVSQLKKDYNNGLISKGDLRTINAWIDLIETSGLDAMQSIERYRDHKLVGNWKGHRSSSFSLMGRIIYKIVDGSPVIIKIVRITGGHDYER